MRDDRWIGDSEAAYCNPDRSHPRSMPAVSTWESFKTWTTGDERRGLIGNTGPCLVLYHALRHDEGGRTSADFCGTVPSPLVNQTVYPFSDTVRTITIHICVKECLPFNMRASIREKRSGERVHIFVDFSAQIYNVCKVWTPFDQIKMWFGFGFWSCFLMVLQVRYHEEGETLIIVHWPETAVEWVCKNIRDVKFRILLSYDGMCPALPDPGHPLILRKGVSVRFDSRPQCPFRTQFAKLALWKGNLAVEQPLEA